MITALINNRAVSLIGLLDNRAVNLIDHEHSTHYHHILVRWWHYLTEFALSCTFGEKKERDERATGKRKGKTMKTTLGVNLKLEKAT